MTKKDIIIELELGARPSTTELEVVEVLVAHEVVKESIKFLKPSRTKGAKTPDILMDGVPWEIKSIEKLGKYTLDHAERAGLRQADNLIFDFRKLSRSLEGKVIKRVKSDFQRTKSWKGLVVVVRFNGECLTFKK